MQVQDRESFFIFRPGGTSDVGRLMQLFEEARRWHREMRVAEWPLFEPELVLDDLNQERVFVLLKDIHIVGSVTVNETDPHVWHDQAPALYIHRLVVSRALKGGNLGRLMVGRVDQIACEQGKRYLRLDCWSSNERLKSYYENIGFTQIGDMHVGDEPSLPAHYQNSTAALFQRKCVLAPSAPAHVFCRTA